MMTKKQLVKNDSLTSKQDLLNTKTSCCSPATTTCCTPTTAVTTNAVETTKETTTTKTRIIVKYDVGFKNTLFIRGKIANLNWEKGVPMKNIKSDEWIWETDLPFPPGEFKVLINDQFYETGYNHPIKSGSTVQYTPRF